MGQHAQVELRHSLLVTATVQLAAFARTTSAGGCEEQSDGGGGGKSDWSQPPIPCAVCHERCSGAGGELSKAMGLGGIAAQRPRFRALPPHARLRRRGSTRRPAARARCPSRRGSRGRSWPLRDTHRPSRGSRRRPAPRTPGRAHREMQRTQLCLLCGAWSRKRERGGRQTAGAARAVRVELPLRATWASEPGAAGPRRSTGPVPESSALTCWAVTCSLTTEPEPLLCTSRAKAAESCGGEPWRGVITCRVCGAREQRGGRGIR